MVSLTIMFWFLIGLFTVVGYMRGWRREVIALTSLIASIAALSQFGLEIISLSNLLLGRSSEVVVIDPSAELRLQFWIQAGFHSTIAFFGYQVLVRIADQAARGKLGERVRANLERRLIGSLVGAINGYLLVGGIWGFLEYQITDSGYVQLPMGVAYAFDANYVQRPFTEEALNLMSYLPLGVISSTFWLVLFFVAFIFIIIALI